MTVTYHNERRNGYTHRFAVATDDPAGTLTNYQPLRVLVNFPPAFPDRQAHLERLCRQQWETLVSAVLAGKNDRLCRRQLDRLC